MYKLPEKKEGRERERQTDRQTWQVAGSQSSKVRIQKIHNYETIKRGLDKGAGEMAQPATQA